MYQTEEEKQKFGKDTVHIMSATNLHTAFGSHMNLQKGNFSMSTNEIKVILNGVKDQKNTTITSDEFILCGMEGIE